MPRATGDGPDASAALREAAGRYTALLEETLGPNLVSVVLFGSVGRGEARSDSDIDLLIVADSLPPGRFARLALLDSADRAFELELERLRARGLRSRLSPLLKTASEASRIVPLYLDMVEDAVLLHDRGGFFAGVLQRLRASLERLGAQRRRRGRIRYWVLKPDFKWGEVVEL